MGKMKRYQKINKASSGYKKGYRYIDYGATWKSPTRFLKKKPKHYKTAETKTRG